MSETETPVNLFSVSQEERERAAERFTDDDRAVRLGRGETDHRGEVLHERVHRPRVVA